MRELFRSERQRGAGRLELAVCAVLFGIFIYTLLDRALYYEEYAEKTAMEMTLRNIRSGLRYKVADMILTNRVSEISTLADENPINWLAAKPENYLGELDAPPASEPEGMWYFDRQNRELIYTPNNRRHFVPTTGGDFSVRYRAIRVSAAGDGKHSPKSTETWVSVVLINRYRWFE